MTGMAVLELLEEKFTEFMDTAPTSEHAEAYEKCLVEVITIIEQIKAKELEKLLALGEKFDEHHMNYGVLCDRGWVESPTDYHSHLSDFSLGEKEVDEVFELMDTDHKTRILVDVVKSKDMNEQLVAHRHGFDYITHTKGHDGINEDGNVFEVKNQIYKRPKKEGRLSLNISFDRLSQNNLRKLNEGRPEIILNSLDGHKLLIEMKLDFTDELIEIYKKKLAGVKGKDTSGCTIAFADYKHAIKEVSYLCDDFESYNFSLTLLEYLNDTQGTNFEIKRKSTLCPNIYEVLTLNSKTIKTRFENGDKMAQIARDLTTPNVTIKGPHIKKVLTGTL